jgi:eukaryotic-like serine/threonine-protein kinase
MDRVVAGRYELEVSLGRGGSGEVWRGRDLVTHRPVAIKLVSVSLIDDPRELAETVGRFRREAMVIAALKHPNIVDSLEAGRFGDQLFLVMELAQGVSLAGMLEQRRSRNMGLFPVASVLRIAEQACAGLAAAHSAGVVHRDIKPSNLMVTAQLGIKIIDFGIARLVADNSPRLTMRGHTVGTIAYMSPEQAQGYEVDGRADLYSLGCVLYELLTGRPPFVSSLPEALLMMQVLDQPVPLTAIRPDLAAGLTELVSDLMQKNPDARPTGALQVINRIKAIEGTLGGQAPAQEADRQTVRADDPRRVLAAATVAEPAIGGSAAVAPGTNQPVSGPAASAPGNDQGAPESGRSTMLTPERLAALAGPETAAAPAWPTRAEPVERGPLTVRAGPPVQGPPWTESSGQVAPVAPVPTPRAAPAVSGSQHYGAASGVPAWPAPRQRHRRRRRWRGLLSTLVTIAILAGAGIYIWERTQGALKVNSVTLTVSEASLGCNGTEKITGTINTNGRGGPIKYQWAQGTKELPELQANDASGAAVVQVFLNWKFTGKGTAQAVAKLQVLAPDSVESSVTFPYSCR